MLKNQYDKSGYRDRKFKWNRYETSLLLSRNQIKTYATMRNMSKSDRLREIASKEKIPLHLTQLDVNDEYLKQLGVFIRPDYVL
ncbi:MAG: hypothetical protein WAM88_05235 [Nitrososphaeraceae archaeon]